MKETIDEDTVQSRYFVRIIAVVLIAMAVSAVVAMMSSDNDSAEADSYTATDGDVEWSIQNDTLTIKLKEGKTTGVIDNYDKGKHPWQDAGYSNLVLGPGITRIGNWAFYDCDFKNFVLPDDVKVINKGAFEDCEFWEGKLEIKDSVEEIQKYAFKNCKKLTEISIPITLDAVVDKDDKNEVFHGVEKLQKITFTMGKDGEGYDYHANDTRSHTPWYFSRETLTEVVFSPGIVSIGDNGLYSASSVKEIILPEGVTSIGRCSFEECSSATKVYIPNTVTSIEPYGFKNCKQINELTVPINLDLAFNTDADPLFLNATEITKITFLPGTAHGDHQAGQGFDYADTACTRTPWYFSRFKLATVELSPGIISIGDYGLYGACVVSEIKLPDGIESLGKYAFQGCSAAKTIDIPDDNQISMIRQYTFKNCFQITELNIPDRITAIGYGAFYGCSALVSEFNLANVTAIGESIFYGCSSMKKVEFPNAITQIPAHTFTNCSSLSDFKMPNAITSIGEGAFSGCASLPSLIIPDTVTSIGLNAFAGCNALSEFSIPICIKHTPGMFNTYGNLKKVTYTPGIGEKRGEQPDYQDGEYQCTINYLNRGITNLVFSEGITYIGDRMFCESGGNCSIVLPRTVTHIGVYAFSHSTFTGTLTLPDNSSLNLEIGNGAFSYCTFTGQLVIPDGITAIGAETFMECSGFNGTLTLPASLIQIGSGAFKECSGFTGPLQLPARLNAIQEGAFKECSGFTGPLQLPTNLVTIEKEAFKECSGFNGTLTLPASLKVIGQNAFDHCVGFTALDASKPENIEIGNSAFYHCVGFKGSLYIRSQIIYGLAFYECTGFDGTLTLGSESSTVLFKEERAFRGCSGFTGELDLRYIRGEQTGESTKYTIPESTFAYCSGFTQLRINSSTNLWIRDFAFNESGLERIYSSGETGEKLEFAYLGYCQFWGCKLTCPVHIYVKEQMEKNIFYGNTNILFIWVESSGAYDGYPFGDHRFFDEEGTEIDINHNPGQFIGHKFYGTSADRMIRNDTLDVTLLHRVTYDLDGGSGPAPLQGDVLEGTMITLNDYSGTRGKDRFIGWSYDGIIYQPGDKIQVYDSDITITALWQTPIVPKYHVTYDQNGGSQAPPVQEDLVEGAIFTVQQYGGHKDLFTFEGWYYNKITYSAGQKIIMGTSDITLVAVWTPVQKHKVTYNTQGGSQPAPVQEDVLEYDTFIIQDYSGVLVRYVFDGWLYNGNLFNPGKEFVMQTTDVEFIAKWTPIYDVRYDLNGGSGDAPVQPAVKEGSVFTVQGCTAVKEGFKFKGWEYDQTIFNEGDTIVMENQNIILKAQWERNAPFHHVRYDLNGGSGDAPVQSDVEEGSTFIVQEYAGTKEGFVFGGWSDSYNLYSAGDVISMGKRDMVLFAVWSSDAPSDNTTVFLFQILGASSVAIGFLQVFLYRRRW